MRRLWQDQSKLFHRAPKFGHNDHSASLSLAIPSSQNLIKRQRVSIQSKGFDLSLSQSAHGHRKQSKLHQLIPQPSTDRSDQAHPCRSNRIITPMFSPSCIGNPTTSEPPYFTTNRPAPTDSLLSPTIELPVDHLRLPSFISSNGVATTCFFARQNLQPTGTA